MLTWQKPTFDLVPIMDFDLSVCTIPPPPPYSSRIVLLTMEDPRFRQPVRAV